MLKDKKGIGLIALVLIIIIIIAIGATISFFVVNKNKEGTNINNNNSANIEKIKIGDYIEYIPDASNSYTKLNSAIASSDNKAISQEKLNWQVLRIYEDGSLDLIGSQTKARLWLQGPLGYNNGVFLMNDICESLYSKKSEGIIARSINIGDIEYWLTEKGKEKRDSYNEFKYKYGETWTISSNETIYYPNIYQYEINKEITSSDSYEGYLNGTTTEKYVESNSNQLDGRESFYALDMREDYLGDGFKVLSTNNNGAYWIGTRWTNYNSGKAAFGLYVINSSYFKGATMAYSEGYGDMTFNYSLRPVVKLEKNVKIQMSNGENSEINPHKIVEY